MSDRGSGGLEERFLLQIRELRDEVRRLTCRVDEQQDQIFELRLQVDRQSRVAEVGSEFGSYIPVEEPSSRSVRSVANESYLEEDLRVRSEERGDATWEFRERVARECGDFLRRALGGDFRGSSGRHRLRISSTLYIVLRDANGRVTLDPARVYRSFNNVRAVCGRGGGFGDAVFIGVPTEREGRIVVERAGATWPSSYQG